MSTSIRATDGQGASSATAVLLGSRISLGPPNKTDTTGDSTMTSAADSPSLSPPPPFTPPLSPIQDRSGEYDFSTPLRIDEQIPDSSAPVQSSAAASELEKQAKLSYTAQVVDMTSRLFWWSSALPGRAVSAVVHKGVEMAVNGAAQQVAQKGINILGMPAPDTPLRRFRNCLFLLHEKISEKIDIDEDLRKRTVETLGVFLAHHKKYLADCYNPSACSPERLTREQETKFKTLLEALDEKQNLANEASFLRPLCDFIDQCCIFQHESHKKKLAKQLVGKVTGTMPSTVAAAPTRPVKHENRSEPLLSPPKPVLKNPLPLIVKEFEELKSLGFRIGLALLILPEECISQKSEEENGKKTEGESRGLAALIQKSNITLDPLKGPNEIFQNLIYIEIDNSKLNYLQKKWSKFTCWLLAPVVLFIVDHVLDQTKDIALYLIGLSPEERLDMVVKLFIQPGLDFIGWLQSEYEAISNTKKLGTTVEGAIGTAIDRMKVRNRQGKDLTSKDLLNRLVSSLFDKYAPALDWSRTATAHFEQRALESESKSPFLSLWFISWSYLTWAVNLLTAPGRWCMNKIIGKVLKTAIVSQLHSKLYDEEGASWDFGKLALNSIYKTLLDKLQKVNRSDRGAEAEDTRRTLDLEQRGFVEKNVQNSIKKLVSNFLGLLDIQGSNVNTLHEKLSPANLVEQGKKGVMGLAYAPVIQKATEEIIHGLQVFLEDRTFSAGLLEVMQDIHQQCLRFNSGDTDTSLARLEIEFWDELQDAVKHGIQFAIKERLDPTKRIQAEADLFIDGLKHDAAVFKDHFSKVQSFTPFSLRKLVQSRDRYLIDSIRRRRETANSETNASTQTHIRLASDQFNVLSAPICAKIDDLVELAKTRKKIEESTEDLDQLIAPLNEAITTQPIPNATHHYSKLQLTLQKIKTKTYPERVQALISKLQGHFDVWRTETLKKDNQALLNGTIETLRKSIESAIEENDQESARLTEDITEKVQKNRLLVDQLVKWTRQLSYFACISERQEMDAIEHLASYLGNEGLSPLILGKLDGFFIFLGTNHNHKGLLSYVIKAYLELPRKSPKEFKKILDQVKLRAQAPPTIPMAPLVN